MTRGQGCISSQAYPQIVYLVGGAAIRGVEIEAAKDPGSDLVRFDSDGSLLIQVDITHRYECNTGRTLRAFGIKHSALSKTKTTPEHTLPRNDQNGKPS